MEKLIYRQGIFPRRVTLGGNISPMYSGCGTSLWTWEIHHPRISPQNESDSVWWLGTQKKRRSQKMDANHMQIRWDFGRPFQQDSRFKISGTGTGSETCHFFLAESKTFDFNTTICQHGSQDHRKPKKTNMVSTEPLLILQEMLAFVQPTFKSIKHVQHRRLDCIHFNYSVEPLSLQVGPRNAGSNQLVGRYW